jgi:hypothetical protein
MRTLTIIEIVHVSGGLDGVDVNGKRLPSMLALDYFNCALKKILGNDDTGGGGDVGDAVIGLPVDHHSDKDSVDYEKEWARLLGTLSAAEKAAFAAALAKAAADAEKSCATKGVAEFLREMASAAASNSAAAAGMASSRASNNLSQGDLGLFDAAVSKAYAAAAALPGGV